MAKTKAKTDQPAQAQAPTTNHTLHFRKLHPKDRASYGVPGVPGIVVFDLKLFADGQAPAAIVLDCALALPVVKEKPAAKPESRPATAA
jgi:hypothetical protein